MGDCEGLYDDLDDTDLGEQIHKLKNVNENLKSHIRNLESDITKLMNEVIVLKKTQVTLAKNISELFKTAQAEIKRKDVMIADLRLQLDNVILRRVGNNKRPANHEAQNNNPKRVRLDVKSSGDKSDSKNFQKQEHENIRTGDENVHKIFENQREVKVNLSRCDSRHYRGQDFDSNPRRSRERRNSDDRNRRSNSQDFQHKSDERFRKSNCRDPPSRHTEKRTENKDRLSSIRENNADRRSRSSSRDNRVDSRASSNKSIDSMRRFPNGRFRKSVGNRRNNDRGNRQGNDRRTERRTDRDYAVDVTRKAEEVTNGNDKENVVKHRKKDSEEMEEGEISIIDSSGDEAEVIFIGKAPREQIKDQDDGLQDKPLLVNRKPVNIEENNPIENLKENELPVGADTVNMVETRRSENLKEKEIPEENYKEAELPKTPIADPIENELPVDKKSTDTNATSLLEHPQEKKCLTTLQYPVKQPELRETPHLKEEKEEPLSRKSIAAVILNKSEQVAIHLEYQSSNDSSFGNNVTLGDSTGDSLLLTTSKPGTSVRRKRRRCVVQLNDD